MTIRTGVTLIVPSSVSNSGGSASLSATGLITFTDINSLSVNGCFSTAYDDYYIVKNYTGSSNAPGVFFRLRSAGSDATGTDYSAQGMDVTGTSINAGRGTGLTAGGMGFSSTGVNGSITIVYNPAVAIDTVWRSNIASGYLNGFMNWTTSYHNVATAYDGFSCGPNTGTYTGEMRIYGIHK